MPGLLRRENEDFLATVLPQLSVMKQAELVLGDYSRRSEHEEAAQSVLYALCLSLRVFQRVILPQLSAFSGPGGRVQCLDTAWLETIGRRLDHVLQATGNRELKWPPPGEDPPAVANDLKQMYSYAAQGTRRFRPINRSML